MLLASDGIWDVLTNDDVVRLCLKKMEKGIPPEQICEEIMTECLSPDLLMTGTDNMTIVLVCFLHNKSYDDFCKKAADYCLRLFPDDGKFQQDKTTDHQSSAKCENGLPQAASDEAEESSSNSGDEQPNASDQNGDTNADANTDAPIENGQADGNAPDDTNATQESKKFKEQDGDADGEEEEDLK